MGGRGGYGGTIVGALILTVLTSLLSSLGLPGGGPPDPLRVDHRHRRGRVHADHRGVLRPPAREGSTDERRAGDAPPGPGPGGHEPQVGGRGARRASAWRLVADGQVPTRLGMPPGRGARRRRRPAGGGRARRGRGARAGGQRRDRRARASTTRPRARSASCRTCRGRGPATRSAARSARRSGVPAFLVNDARAFGLAELRLGAGRGASSMVGLTLGTGVGGVIAVGGRVHQGHDGTGGELGHQTIDPDGPWCGCGNRGCVEAYARADQIAAACGTATRRGGGPRRPARATRGRWPASPRSAGTWGSGSATPSSSSTPTGSSSAAASRRPASSSSPRSGPSSRSGSRSRRSTRWSSSPPSSGRWPGRSGRRSTVPSAPRRRRRTGPAATVRARVRRGRP